MDLDSQSALGPPCRDQVLRRALTVNEGDHFFSPCPPDAAALVDKPQTFPDFLRTSRFASGGMLRPLCIVPVGINLQQQHEKVTFCGVVKLLESFLSPIQVSTRDVRAVSASHMRLYPASRTPQG